MKREKETGISLPPQVNGIIDRLQQAGYEAYAVGGCVRDSLLGREPEDWDITTSAQPEEVRRMFDRTLDTGIRHGTVTVMLGKNGYEVTTFRIDGIYEDGRHPKQVQFTPDLAEDLRRRDFTVNAMAYNGQKGLVDLYGGREDLEAGIIRCVGDPRERFSEDALRMLRALRFSAQLSFSIDLDTFLAIRELAPSIKKVSAERIRTELVKLLVSPHPETMREVYESGIADQILPEFSVMMRTEQHSLHHRFSVGEHTICSLTQVRPDPVLRLAMLLHDVAKPACKTTDEDGWDHFKGHPSAGKEMAREILRRLKFDNDTIRAVTRLVAAHDVRPPLNERAVRRCIVKTGEDIYPQLFEVKRADVLAQSSWQQEEKLENIRCHERIYREIIQKKQALGRKDLAVNGRDLIELGIAPGKQIGEVLDLLLEHVLEYPEDNQREILLQISRRKNADGLQRNL